MKAAKIIDLGVIKLNLVDSQKGKIPLLFLHGFPDYHYGWRKQIPAFEEWGYRVIVPDQRGYNLSDKPAAVADYNLDRLGQDMLDLLDHLQLESAFVIGHDWGGAVAWWLAHHHPERVRGLIILNMPHPRTFISYLKSHRSQMLKSWYMFLFQLPVLPEWALSRGNYVHFAQTMQDDARRGAVTQQDLVKYRQAWSQPGAFKGMINWYRAAVRSKPRPFPSTAIKLPTLILWGSRDPYLEADLAEASLAECANGRVKYAKHAGHWLQQDEPEWVNEKILEFVQAQK